MTVQGTGDIGSADASMAQNFSTGAFLLDSFKAIYDQNKMRKQAEEQGERIGKQLQSTYDADEIKQGLRDLDLRDTYEGITKKALTSRATFQVQGMETKSGATAQALMNDFKKNELDAKRMATRKVERANIDARANQVVRYSKARQEIKKLEDSVPSPGEVMMQIGMSAVKSYATFGVAPF